MTDTQNALQRDIDAANRRWKKKNEGVSAKLTKEELDRKDKEAVRRHKQQSSSASGPHAPYVRKRRRTRRGS